MSTRKDVEASPVSAKFHDAALKLDSTAVEQRYDVACCVPPYVPQMVCFAGCQVDAVARHRRLAEIAIHGQYRFCCRSSLDFTDNEDDAEFTRNSYRAPSAPMYLDYWGLTQSPFAEYPSSRFYYRGPDQEEALARVEFLVHHGKRLGALEGSAGQGKTYMLAVLARQLRRDGFQVASVNLSGKAEEEFLWDVAVALGVGPLPGERTIQLWRRLADKLAENRFSRVPTVVLCDDVGHGEDASARILTRLHQIDCVPETRWTIILAGTPEAISNLDPRLRQVVGLPIRLGDWDLADTREYLRHVTAAAGRTEPLFQDDAIARLHAVSKGNPRQTARTAELALLAGAVEQLAVIDGPLLDAVSEDFALEEASAPLGRC